MTKTDVKTEKKQISDLTLRELDRIYSLVRIGDWRDAEIGRAYRLSEDDVRKVFDNYLELREMLEKNHHGERLPQEPSPEQTTKQRKRRSDARYASHAERQAAYRARLQESRHASIEQPSPTVDTDRADQADEELSVSASPNAVAEAGPENPDPQQSTTCSSSEECYGTSENMRDPVTLEACSESEVLRVIEE
jgi:hypothetical protein